MLYYVFSGPLSLRAYVPEIKFNNNNNIILIVDRSIYVFHIVYNLHVMLDDTLIINEIWTSDCYVLLVCILYC